MLAFLAALFAIPYELRKWRRQKLLERRSEIAGKLAVATIKFAEALRFIANPLSYGDPTKTTNAIDAGFESFNRKVAHVQEELKAFTDCWSEAEVYLPEKVNNATKKLWEQWNDLRSNCITWYEAAKQNAREEQIEYHKKVYGKETRAAVNECEKTLKELLSPIVRLEDEP